MADKPPLLVVALGILPGRGSEPGKGFNWTRGLARHYQVHVLCWPNQVAPCQASGHCDEWEFHPVEPDYEASMAGRSSVVQLWHYREWCRNLLPACRSLMETLRPVGLHHVTLGTFRVLPRYDKLGLPYTLGPLGGGETAPLAILLQAGLPAKELAKELARLPLNHAIRLVPAIRRVLRKARRVLATTPETERLLRRAGARETAVVFPDVMESPVAADAALASRRAQMEELRTGIRCIWSARFLWWKGGPLAARFVQALRARGIDATLDVYSGGPGLERFQAQCARLGLGEHVRFHGMVPRDQLLAAYARAHLYVYPTLHDSSSSAIPEAYSTGLPSMTVGLGGVHTAAAPEAGLNARVTRIADWIEAGVGMVANWQKDPGRWLAACGAALRKMDDFGAAALDRKIAVHLSPDVYRGADSPSPPSAVA